MARTSVLRKVTFSLPSELLREARGAVEAGLFPSQNALVREALENELRCVRKEQLRREFQEAARDPLFLCDLQEAEQGFRTADAETARMIPDD